MLDPVTTNGAAILTMIALWSTLSSLITYMVTSHRKQQRIDVLEHHLREADSLVDDLLYHEHAQGYAEYVVQEDGSWIRVD